MRCNIQKGVGDEICIAAQNLMIALDGSGSLREYGLNAMRDPAAEMVMSINLLLTHYDNSLYDSSYLRSDRIMAYLPHPAGKAIRDACPPASLGTGLWCGKVPSQHSPSLQQFTFMKWRYHQDHSPTASEYFEIAVRPPVATKTRKASVDPYGWLRTTTGYITILDPKLVMKLSGNLDYG